MTKRDVLRIKLDDLCEGFENRKEIERLVFDLWHSQQEAYRDKEKDSIKYAENRTRLTQMERELVDAKLRIQQLEQQNKSRDFKISQVQVENDEISKQLEGFTNPVINLDLMNIDFIKPIFEQTDPQIVQKHLRILIDDVRVSVRKIAIIAKNRKFLNSINDMTDDQIAILTHLGFSETFFLRAITGDHTCTPIAFIVQGERLDPPKDAVQKARKMERDSKKLIE